MNGETPKLAGNLDDMSKLSAGKSLEDIKQTGVSTDTVPKVESAWTLKVSETPEVKTADIDPAKFSTSTKVKESEQQFGAFAKAVPKAAATGWTHYVKEDEVSEQPAAIKPETISEIPKVKQERQPRKPKVVTEPTKPKATRKTTEEQLLAKAWIKQVNGTSAKDTVPETKAPKTEAEKEIEARTHSDSMLGPVIPGVEADLRTEEEKRLGGAWETAVSTANQEKLKNESDLLERKAKFNSAKEQWRTTRDLANKLEAEYAQKYEAEVLAQSKKLATAPRRLLGFQPKLSGELLSLKNQTDAARANFNSVAKEFLQSRDSSVAERAERRLLPKVAAILPKVHQERLDIQKRAINEAWGESKYIRPTLEALARHKKKVLFPTLIAGAVFNPIGLAAGLGVGLGGKKLLDKAWVDSSRKQLEKARANIGQDYYAKSYEKLNEELEHLTFNTDAREKRAKVIATAAGVAAGMTASSLASGMDYVRDGSMQLTDIPDPKLYGVTPPELQVPELPKEAPIPQSRPTIEFMGDAKVAEAVQPQVEEALKKIAAGEKNAPFMATPPEAPVPEPRPVPLNNNPFNSDSVFSDLSDPRLKGVPPELQVPELPKEAPIPEARPEIGANEVHKVVKGDNVWNILEGKGSDANPVGGKSEVLEGMTQASREDALNQLLAYAEKHPEFGKEVGALKSGGNLDRIYPGEEINVSLLDAKLRELLGIETTAVTPPTPEVSPEVSPELDPSHPEGPEETYSRTPEDEPYGNYQPFADESTKVIEAKVAPVETSGQSVASYVRSIEQPRNGMLDALFGMGKPNVAGTFDQIKDLSVGEVKAMVANDEVPDGVNVAGFDRWADLIKGAANDNETVAEHVSKLANTRVA